MITQNVKGTLTKSLAVACLLLASSLLGVAFGQTPEQMLGTPLPMDPEVLYGKLDNGMTYYIRANKEPKNRAEFYILHHVGAILEEDEQIGLAHFLEHMAFNGTKNFPKKDLLNFLEHNGVKFGNDVNAFTTQDMTCYNISDVPTTRTGLLDSCVQILCDWSGDIALDADEIDAERGVISEELRTRRNSNWRLMQSLIQTAARGSKYTERDVIGTLDQLKSFKYQAIRDFYHKWYRPEFQTIIVVGDFDAKAMEARVKRMAGALPKRPDVLKKPTFQIPPAEGVDFGSYTDPEVTMNRVDIIYKLPSLVNEPKNVKTYSESIVRQLVVNLINSRFSELSQQADKPFVMGMSQYMSLFEPIDMMYMIAVGQPGNLQSTMKGLITESQRIRQKGFTETELAREKAEMERAIQKQFDERNKQKNSYYVTQYINHFTKNEPIPPIELEFQLSKAIIPAITVDAVNAMAAKLLDGKNVVVFASAPESEKDQIPTEDQVQSLFNGIYDSDLDAWVDNVKQEPLLEKRPTPGRVSATKTNKAYGTTEWVLSNGVKVIVKPTDFKEDQVLLSGFAPGGLSLVKDEDIPSAMVASDVQESCGLGNFDATELEKALAGKNVSAGTSIGTYRTTITANSSAKIEELETMFQLVYLHFTAPRFEEKGYNNVMQMMQTALSGQENNPDYLYQKRLSEAIYGGSIRRAMPDKALLEKVSLAKAERVYTERFANAQNFTFVVVGNVNVDELKPFVEYYLGSLPAGGKEYWRDDRVRELAKNVDQSYEQKMQDPKTRIALAWGGKAKFNQDNLIYSNALSQILDLRCTEEVREEQGGTYGVSSDLSLSNRPIETAMAIFVFDTDPAKADALMPIVERIFRNLSTSISKTDIEKVKKHMLKSHEDAVRTNSYWINELRRYELSGVNTYTGYAKKVNALSPASLQKAAKSFFSNPTSLKLVMKGFKAE